MSRDKFKIRVHATKILIQLDFQDLAIQEKLFKKNNHIKDVKNIY